jgi:hypothetical protein
MIKCFGCAEEILGKPFKDKDGNTRYQDKPIYDNQNQPNCIPCFMYAIGMEYRREYLKLKETKK